MSHPMRPEPKSGGPDEAPFLGKDSTRMEEMGRCKPSKASASCET